MSASLRTLLLRVLAIPSAPFRESLVARELSAFLDEERVPHFEDPHGNVIVGVGSKREYLARLARKDRGPLRVFMAHMDHPGFHGVRWIAPDRLAFRWHGGSPSRGLHGSKVWLATESGWVGAGTLLSAELGPSKRAIRSGVIRVPPAQGAHAAASAKQLFGGFAFRAPVWRSGRRLFTKAADDLVGACALVATAARVRGRSARAKSDFLGILTRAEEVGFIGAIAHFELGWLARARRPVVLVSLETSRTFPGAEIGHGPVVRLGDKAGPFQPGPVRALTLIAQRALPGRHQRRIMDGGTCEATAALAYGIPAAGISIPLGNYHNQNLQGGQDSGSGRLSPAPEFVETKDIEGMVRLCEAAAKPHPVWSSPWESLRGEFHLDMARYRRLMKE